MSSQHVESHKGSRPLTTLPILQQLITINSEDKNIITIEDPIEYHLAGIRQMHVDPKVGLLFDNALSAILRQDPDVIMVGEIRNTETAKAAVQAALTGHLVFSTLHTNDAPSAVTRLVDMGIEPYLITSTVRAVLAQRLVRVICSKCKKTYEPQKRELSELGVPDDKAKVVKFYKGEGCSECNGSGYKGRTGIYEMMLINEEVRNLIYKRESAGTIKKFALDSGLQTLRMDGARKVLAGVTTISEVLRVTQADVM